jgi:hypothetical protein
VTLRRRLNISGNHPEAMKSVRTHPAAVIVQESRFSGQPASLVWKVLEQRQIDRRACLLSNLLCLADNCQRPNLDTSHRENAKSLRNHPEVAIHQETSYRGREASFWNVQ